MKMLLKGKKMGTACLKESCQPTNTVAQLHTVVTARGSLGWYQALKDTWNSADATFSALKHTQKS